MTGLRRLWRAVAGERCDRCHGAGSWLGHSPTAPLNTFRPVVTLICPQCRGSGRV